MLHHMVFYKGVNSNWVDVRTEQLLQRLENMVQNNPNLDSPSLTARKVKRIGKRP